MAYMLLLLMMNVHGASLRNCVMGSVRCIDFLKFFELPLHID
jgi:hypothetical protein